MQVEYIGTVSRIARVARVGNGFYIPKAMDLFKKNAILNICRFIRT